MEEMTALNPSLLRAVTPPDTSFDLHLPAGTASLFEAAIARVPEAKRTAWRYHRLQPGETLAAVARQFRVTPADLADVNQLKESDALDGVEALVVPTAPVAIPNTRTLMYTARKGDTLVTIADRFGVSLDQLRRWNKLTGSKVEPGKRLHVGDAANVPHASRSRRGLAATKAAASGEKARESGSAKGHASKKTHSSSSQNGSSSSTRQGASTTVKRHATSTKPATGAANSRSAGVAKHRDGKSSTKKKVPTTK